MKTNGACTDASAIVAFGDGAPRDPIENRAHLLTHAHTHAILVRRNLTNCEMVAPNKDKLVRLHWMACWTNSYAASVHCKQKHPRKCMTTRECSLAFEHMGCRKWMAAGGCILERGKRMDGVNRIQNRPTM